MFDADQREYIGQSAFLSRKLALPHARACIAVSFQGAIIPLRSAASS